MRIVAVDPGGMTGLVLVNLLDHIPSEFNAPSHELVKGAEPTIIEVNCHDINKGFAEMNTIVHEFGPDVVVYEMFYLWTVAADLSPVKLITLMEWEWSRWTELVPQNPSERSVITDLRLKNWWLWSPGKKDANAAMKHLLVWMRKSQS